MSLHEYDYAIRQFRDDAPFYGFIMAAMLKADDKNLIKLKTMWPGVWEELSRRYHSPGGLIDDESRPEFPP